MPQDDESGRIDPRVFTARLTVGLALLGLADSMIAVAHARGSGPLASLPGDASVWSIAAGIVLASAGTLAFRIFRALRDRVPLAPEWSFTPRSAAIAYGAALAIAAVVALLSKVVIESTSDATYTIHWDSTLPAVALPIAWFIHAWRNRR